MNWNLIPTFLAVLDGGSLSAAARQLGSSQPTVGRRIAELEAELDMVLFSRAARGLVPTDAAHQLAERARDMARAAASMAMFAEGRAETIAGTIRVTASEVVATYILPAILSDLMQAEPEIEVEVVSSNAANNLLLREADIAVRMVQPTQNDLVARKLGDLEIGIFAHESYLDRAGAPTGFSDLFDHVFIGYDRDDLMIRAMNRMGILAKRGDFRFRTDDQVGHVEAIAAGVGIGATQVSLMSRRPGVRRLFADLPIPPLPVWLAAHQEVRHSARVRRVYDHLADGLGRYIRSQRSVRSTNQ